MEHLSEINPKQSNLAVDIPAFSLGRTLREAREHLGLSVADVAAQIKFAPRQIEALEADDFKHLPELAFVRGFVRSYAKILHLDAPSLLANLKSVKDISGELSPASVEVPFPDASLAKRQNLVWFGLALLLVVIVVAFAVTNYKNPQLPDKVTRIETPVSLPAEVVQDVPDPIDVKPAIQPESGSAKAKSPDATGVSMARVTKPVIAAPKISTPAQTEVPAIQSGVSLPKTPPSVSAIPSDLPPNPGTIRLEFDEESWVEIKDRDGKILTSRAYLPGSNLRLEGNAPFSLLIGHAPAVRLYYQDKPVNLAPHIRQSTAVASLTLE